MRAFCLALAICVLAVPAFAGETSVARFDAAGLSLNGKTVDSSVLELRSHGDNALLASVRCVEPISGSLSVEMASGRMLTVEPGVRLERKAEGFRLSSAAGRKIRLSGAEGEISNAATVDFSVTAEGWMVGGVALKEASLKAALPQTQEEESLLGRLRAKSKNNNLKWANVKSYRVFSNGDIFVTYEATEGHSIRILLQVSPGQ